jgi:hypothetical protein
VSYIARQCGKTYFYLFNQSGLLQTPVFVAVNADEGFLDIFIFIEFLFSVGDTLDRGCQLFLGTIYQNVENRNKIWPQNFKMANKYIYQIAVKYPEWS